MDEAFSFMVAQLKKVGFSSYDEFMYQATLAELKSWDKNNSQTTQPLSEEASKIAKIAKLTSDELNFNFDRLSRMNVSSEVIKTQVGELEKSFRELDMLSINMQINSERFGNSANSIRAVSLGFSNIAAETESSIKKFLDVAYHLRENIEACGLQVAYLKIQIMMVDFFVRESLAAKDFSGMNRNRINFCELYEASIKQLLAKFDQLNELLRHLETELAQVRQMSSSLEVVRLVGCIETSRDEVIQESFSSYLMRMKEFVEFLKKTNEVVRFERDQLSHFCEIIIGSSNEVQANVATLFDLATKS